MTCPADVTGNGNTDNMMGTFIDDAIYNYLNTDGTAANDVDLFFNNAGGIRADWCYVGGVVGEHRLRRRDARPGAADLRQHVHGPAVRQRDGRSGR